MKKCFVAALALLLAACVCLLPLCGVSAAAESYQYAALDLLGSGELTVYRDAAATADGGFVACGVTRCKTGDFAGVYQSGWSLPYGFVVKYDADLNRQWIRGIGGSGGMTMSIDGVAVLADGGIVTVGSSGRPAHTIDAGMDALMVKFNANGVKLWEKALGGSGTDAFTCVAARGSGFVAGGSSDAADGSFADLPAGGTNAILYTFDASGNVLWNRALNGSRAASVIGVAADADENVFLSVQTTSSDLDFAPFGLADYRYANDVVLKYDAAGTRQWFYSLTSSGIDSFPALVSDGAGGCVVAGNYRLFSAVQGDGAFADLYYCGGSDAVITHLGADGAVVWTKLLAGLYDDTATAIAAAGSGYVVCGSTSSSNREFNMLSGRGKSDAYTAYLTADGVTDAVRALGGSREDGANAVACAGGVTVTFGRTGSNDGEFAANAWLTDEAVEDYVNLYGIEPYTGFAVKSDIDLNVTGIRVLTPPDCTTYDAGDTLDPAGLTIEATYADGRTETLTAGFACAPTALNTPGEQTITVTYAGRTATFSVIVESPTPVRLDVASVPEKTIYYVGDTLNPAGLTLTATYASGRTETVTAGFTCTPETLTAAGTQAVTVEYQGATTFFFVNVESRPATSRTLTFLLDGGVYSTASYDAGAPIQLPPPPEKTGYSFTAWEPAVPDVMPDEDLTVTAVFRIETYQAVFTADGVTVASVPYTVEDASIQEPAVPEKPGYTGRWAAYELTPGGVTVEAVYSLKALPRVKIDRYKKEITVDYRTTITFSATAENLPDGGEVQWLVNEDYAETGTSCTVQEARDDFEIQAVVVDAYGNIRARSEAETVHVNHGFFARLIAFFRGLFKKLPVITQAVRDAF